MNQKVWSNLAKIVYRRTYARKDTGTIEDWPKTVERVLAGNFKKVLERSDLREEALEEMKVMRGLMLDRKAGPAGRGYWFSGAPAHEKIGGVALNNCWFITSENWENFIIAMDLLMLGGGVGLSVEHQFTSKLPRIKKGVSVVHKPTKDADFIVPDSREGWCELYRRILEAFFVTGKSFSYSTVCVRGYGELIAGFGGTASGPIPLVVFVNNICKILSSRAGKSVRPIDAGDLLCATGEMVVAGNVRRSAIILIGDAFDKEYLKAKRWDLGPIPTYRSTANFSVVCEDIENDLNPLFWKTYEHGEPYGLINRKNIQAFGRMGELREDTAVGVNPCKPLNSLILTPNGYITFKQAIDLPGDSLEVIGESGEVLKAVKPFKTGENRQVYRITLSNGSYLYGTPEHRHLSSDGTTWKRIDELKLDDRLSYFPRAVFDTNIFNVERYESGLIAGWIHGDGWFRKRGDCAGYEVGMCFGINEFDIVEYFENKLGVKTKPHEQKPNTCKYFNSHRTDLATRLLKEGMRLDKTDLTWLYGKDKDFKIGFIKALFSADGSVLKQNNVELYSTRKSSLDVISNILREFGLYNTITVHNNAKSYISKDGKTRNNKITFKINVYAGQFKKIGFLSKMKSDLLEKHVESDIYRYKNYVTVVDIDSEYSCEDVYDITVDSADHLFVDTGVITHNCAEATLNPFEPCNLTEQALSNIADPKEFILSSRMCYRYAKRVTMEYYHHEQVQKVIEKNRRVGVGITGCLESPLFNPETLNDAYQAIQAEDEKYSSQLGINKSIKTTVIKPSGTMSKVLDQRGEGIHAAFSRYMIQRIRVAANDPLIPLLREAGHYMEPVMKFDGTIDHNTLVVDFYLEAPSEMPCADEGFDTWKQLDVLLMAQKYWADQAVSVTVYYKKEELQQIKEWLSNNFKYLKTISFLCHNDHGFKQAPKEAISKEKYEELSVKVRPIEMDKIDVGTQVEGLECEGGVCPIR